MAMIISTKPKQYELPDEGEHRAVLCDIVDLGEVRETKQTLAASKWKPSKDELAQIIGAIWPERRPPGTRKPTFIQITV